MKALGAADRPSPPVKHSIYVQHKRVRSGIGRLLIQASIDACAAAGLRQRIGYIDAENDSALALHERFGFVKVGHPRGVAYRQGKWPDSVIVQRSLGPCTTEPPPQAYSAAR